MKSAVFIDGANLFATCQNLRIHIDYAKLIPELTHRFETVLRAFYYTAVLETEQSDHVPLIKLIDWLDYNGYSVITKPAKVWESQGIRHVKGNMDVEMVTDIVEMCPYVDRIILFTGDGDFRRIVEWAQSRGKIVTVISTIETRPPMIADILRRQADSFIELKPFYEIHRS